MPSAMVYLFLMLRGFLGSLSSKPAKRFLSESMSLHDFLQRREFELPGWATILENVNAVSTSTRAFIMDKQIEYILGEELDDFKQLTIDSTAVKANSAWPSDGKILTGLLGRAYRLGQQLDAFGLVNLKKGWLPRWLEEMGRLEFQICLSAGKPKSRGKMKKNYRKLLKKGQKSIGSLDLGLKSFNSNLRMETLLPSRRELLTALIKQIQVDLVDAQRVIVYCEDRVFNDQKLPSTQKVLSLSDGSAAYIQKGGRTAVIGYKPQLVRSENGLVTCLLVPEGNAADSINLEPAIRESIRRTGVTADIVSTDDGYASAKGRDEVLSMGVKMISISGSKGKKLTDPEDWESETYRNARANRSAIASATLLRRLRSSNTMDVA
jgi:hypothetical protein